MVKLGKGSALHAALQNTIVTTISDPNYSFSLPKLSDWESVVSSSAREKQRLEFVGDAIMHLSVALYLYRLFPDGAPGLYTNIRSAVNTNATFTHLMAKAGAYELPSRSHGMKAAADSFEVIVAALYLERGFADVCAWVQEQYAPLIAAARESYDKCFSTSDCSSSVLLKKRRRVSPDSAGMPLPLLKKIRMSSGRNSPRSTLMAQRVIHRMKSKGKVKLCLPAKKPKVPLENRVRLPSWRFRTPEPDGSSSYVIDLTMESDTDSEEATLSRVANAPCSSSKIISSSRNLLSMSQHDTAPQSGQSSLRSTGFQWPPGGNSSTSPAPAHSSPESSLPPSLFPVTIPPLRITPHLDLRFLRRPGRSPSLQSDNTDIASGTHTNPIIIEDSGSENETSRL